MQAVRRCHVAQAMDLSARPPAPARFPGRWHQAGHLARGPARRPPLAFVGRTDRQSRSRDFSRPRSQSKRWNLCLGIRHSGPEANRSQTFCDHRGYCRSGRQGTRRGNHDGTGAETDSRRRRCARSFNASHHGGSQRVGSSKSTGRRNVRDKLGVFQGSHTTTCPLCFSQCLGKGEDRRPHWTERRGPIRVGRPLSRHCGCKADGCYIRQECSNRPADQRDLGCCRRSSRRDARKPRNGGRQVCPVPNAPRGPLQRQHCGTPAQDRGREALRRPVKRRVNRPQCHRLQCRQAQCYEAQRYEAQCHRIHCRKAGGALFFNGIPSRLGRPGKRSSGPPTKAAATAARCRLLNT